MMPARQRLGAGQPSVGAGELRLEQDFDLLFAQRGRQFFGPTAITAAAIDTHPAFGDSDQRLHASALAHCLTAVCRVAARVANRDAPP